MKTVINYKAFLVVSAAIQFVSGPFIWLCAKNVPRYIHEVKVRGDNFNDEKGVNGTVGLLGMIGMVSLIAGGICLLVALLDHLCNQSPDDKQTPRRNP